MGSKPKPVKEVTLLWNNGEITTGKTFKEVEQNMRMMQHQWNMYATQAEFRSEMRKRAKVWCGHMPRICNSHRGFIESLAECGLFMLVIDEEVENA